MNKDSNTNNKNLLSISYCMTQPNYRIVSQRNPPNMKNCPWEGAEKLTDGYLAFTGHASAFIVRQPVWFLNCFRLVKTFSFHWWKCPFQNPLTGLNSVHRVQGPQWTTALHVWKTSILCGLSLLFTRINILSLFHSPLHHTWCRPTVLAHLWKGGFHKVSR